MRRLPPLLLALLATSSCTEEAKNERKASELARLVERYDLPWGQALAFRKIDKAIRESGALVKPRWKMSPQIVCLEDRSDPYTHEKSWVTDGIIVRSTEPEVYHLAGIGLARYYPIPEPVGASSEFLADYGTLHLRPCKGSPSEGIECVDSKRLRSGDGSVTLLYDVPLDKGSFAVSATFKARDGGTLAYLYFNSEVGAGGSSFLRELEENLKSR